MYIKYNVAYVTISRVLIVVSTINIQLEKTQKVNLCYIGNMNNCASNKLEHYMYNLIYQL